MTVYYADDRLIKLKERGHLYQPKKYIEKVSRGSSFLMGHLKAHELIQKPRADLLEELATLEKKLFELRAQIATQSSRQKLSEILTVRRDVARVKTVLMEQQRKALNEKYAGAKHVPKDIRPHNVKAQRKELPAKYANKLTPKAAKRAKFLRPVKYALKAE